VLNHGTIEELRKEYRQIQRERDEKKTINAQE